VLSAKDICNCDIGFEVKNITPEKYTFKFVIRSQERRPAIRGASIEIIAQHQYESEISAHGIFRFSDTFKYKRQPDRMVVTIVNKKPI